MTPTQWQQIKEITSKILELDTGDRSRMIKTLCKDDADLCDAVMTYMVDEKEITDFLEPPTTNTFDSFCEELAER